MTTNVLFFLLGAIIMYLATQRTKKDKDLYQKHFYQECEANFHMEQKLQNLENRLRYYKAYLKGYTEF